MENKQLIRNMLTTAQKDIIDFYVDIENFLECVESDNSIVEINEGSPLFIYVEDEDNTMKVTIFEDYISIIINSDEFTEEF